MKKVLLAAHRKQVGVFGYLPIVFLLLLMSACFASSLPAGQTITLKSAVYYGGAGNEWGTSVTTGGGGVFVSGMTDANGGDGLVLQYTNSLTLGWSAQWPDLSGEDYFNGIAVSADGVYIAASSYGRTSDTVGGKEIKGIVVKFPLTGATGGGYDGAIWDKQTPSAPGAFSYGGGEWLNALVQTVESGQPYVYATGASQSGFSNGGRFYLSKVASSSTILWTATDTVSNSFSSGNSVTALNSNIYVGGRSDDSGSKKGYLLKYDANGTRLWSRTSVGVGGWYNGITAFNGYIYAVGLVNYGSTSDFLIEKWDENGNLIWSRQYDRNSSEDILYGVTGAGSTIYAAGSTNGNTAGGRDAIILEIGPATGDIVSSTLYGGVQDDIARSIVVNGTDLYMAGETQSYGAGGKDVMVCMFTFSSLPTATTGSATNVTSSSATLNGTVNANGTSTTAWFNYGITSGSYSGTSTTQSVSGTSTTSVSSDISGLSASTTYYYRIAAQSSAGTSYGSETSFITSAPTDTTAPTVSSTSPASNATSVAISSTITATFSEDMSSSTINTSTFTLSSSSGSNISGTVLYSNKVATYTPSSNLSYSTTYTATITTGVKDTAGNAMSSNYTWSFTTVSTPDTTAPSGSVSINSGAAYSNSTAVTLNFSVSDSVGVTGYYISTNSTTPSASASGWTSVASTTSYSGSVSYSLSGSDGSKTVYAWYKDAAGNVSNTASDSITLDTTAPTVTITSPTSSATYTSTNSTVSLGGSASDSTSGVSSVTWSNSGGGSGTASGTTSWSVSSVSLTSGSNVITVTATDNAGNTGTDTITVTYNEPTAPTVTTGSASYVTSHFAMMSGTVNPNNASTTVWYEYGTKSGSYENKTFTQTVTGSSATTVNTLVSGLSANTSYYYRIAAQNSAGTAYGSEKSFTTSKLMDVKAGGNHSLGLKLDGTVWAWGVIVTGQNETTESHTPVQVSGMSGVVAIAGGRLHSLALKSDGTVLAWGLNNYGQLGDGTTMDRSTPVQVSGLSGVVAIAGGDLHSLALKSDGTVWAWGWNDFGLLGDGTTTDRSIPVQVSGLSSVVAIGVGQAHSLALKSDGTVWAWGANIYGGLGDGTTTDRSTPVQVNGLSGVVAIAGGGYHSLALKSDGAVWTWGYNSDGQLGDGTTTDRSTPVQVSGMSGVAAIAGGYSHSLALKSDGTVWAWGNNGDGELGDGTTTDRSTPVQVSGMSGVAAIAGGYSHSLALKSDGTVWAWGFNGSGQLGDGTTTSRYTPVQVSGLDLDEITPTCEATSISVSPDSLTLAAIESSLVTVTVTGEDNCAVEGETVTSTIDATSENYIVVSSASQTTDANGQAMFIITALNNSGNAAVVFQAGSLKKILTVSVISTQEGIVFGFVNDQDEQPLKGVTVTIVGANGRSPLQNSTETDEDGYYEFGGLSQGTYALTYEKEGFSDQTQDISLKEGEAKDLGTVTMEQIEKGKISGYVVNIKGDPIESVRLKLKGIKTKVIKAASSDADGFFEFTDLGADTYVIFAKKKGYKKTQQKVALEEGETTEIEIVMKKTSKRVIELMEDDQ